MTNPTMAEDLLAAEHRLHAAQRAGDVAALDQLLHDRLLAIGPDGARHSKADDLDAYRSGSSVIEQLVEEDLELLVVDATGVTFFTGTVAGTFAGQPFAARMRYARTWNHDATHGWRIVAAHIAVAP
jgi:ketosteroid isomerase-like protein